MVYLQYQLNGAWRDCARFDLSELALAARYLALARESSQIKRWRIANELGLTVHAR